jgi:glycosyltransferase involved in cell wall biosynthesis
MSLPTVSVIIPNYNREMLIGETIANLLAQSLPPHEIIVVDDGSMDKSVEVIRAFGDKVKLIQQVNQGPGTARNAGLKTASGEFVQFQDSDDLFCLNKLEAQAKALQDNQADIAFSPWVKLNFNGKSVSLEDQALQQKMPPSDLSLPSWWLRGWSTVFQSLLFRRSFLTKVGFYRADLMPSEDTEFFFRLLTSSPRVVFTDETLMLYRLHNVNKITQDEGISRSRRVVDWARCLNFMAERSEEVSLKLDLTTRSIFLAGVRKHLRFMPTDAPKDLVGKISGQVAQLPSWQLSLTENWQRFSEQLRLRLQGSRWMPAYQAGPLTEKQRNLIQQAGFTVA